MKKFKIVPSLILLALCVAVLGIGIYAASPASNQITGTVTVTAANVSVTIEAYSGSTATGDPIASITTRTGDELKLGSLEFVRKASAYAEETGSNRDSLEYADKLSEVEDIVITFKIINNSSTTDIGAYFSTDDMKEHKNSTFNLRGTITSSQTTVSNVATMTITSTDYLQVAKKVGSTEALEH